MYPVASSLKLTNAHTHSFVPVDFSRLDTLGHIEKRPQPDFLPSLGLNETFQSIISSLVNTQKRESDVECQEQLGSSCSSSHFWTPFPFKLGFLYEYFNSRFAQMDSFVFLLTFLKSEADHKQHIAQKALEALNKGHFGKPHRSQHWMLQS